MKYLSILLLLVVGCVQIQERKKSSSLPDFLLINGERWYVSPATLPLDILGETNCNKRIILYSMDQQIGELRVTLFHEIIHASRCKVVPGEQKKANWGNSLDSPEHEFVYNAGFFLAGFVHDNPEFMEWAEDWR